MSDGWSHASLQCRVRQRPGSRRVARRVVVDAAPGQIFALVADPHRHRELDGSGTIRDVAVDGPHELSEGARFSVGMKQFGVPYRITSTVTEFTDGSVIEWQHPLGHRWRWEFAEIGAGSARIHRDLRLLHVQGTSAARAHRSAEEERRGDHPDARRPGESLRLNCRQLSSTRQLTKRPMATNAAISRRTRLPGRTFISPRR